MAEIRHLENRHDVIFFCRGWFDLVKFSETGTEWHVDCGHVVEIGNRCRIPIWRTFARIQWHVIPKPPATLQGAAARRIQSHVIPNDMPLNSPKRPPYWNSTSGFHFHISPQSTCHSVGLPVCEILSKSDHPQQRIMTSCRFSRWRISAILDCRDPIMGSLKSPAKLT